MIFIFHFVFLQTTPLHLAAKEGYPEVISLLLSRGADITLTDHTGRNCLDLAVDHGRKYDSSLNFYCQMKPFRQLCEKQFKRKVKKRTSNQELKFFGQLSTFSQGQYNVLNSHRIIYID